MKTIKNKVTEVQFWIEDKEGRTVLAFFPNDIVHVGKNGQHYYACYSHVGQHSSLDILYLNKCSLALPSQYRELLCELINEGYSDLKILNPIDPYNIAEILQDYQVCALWACDIDSLSIYDILPSLQTKMLSDVTKFVSDNYTDLIASGLTSSEIGHSLWLTQNRHGAGFFDYSIDQGIIDRLTEAAQNIGEYDLWVNELNNICIQ